MKYLVETPGPFCLHDLVGRQTVQSHRPTVVRVSAFIESHRGGKITILEQLADEADDETLAVCRDDDELLEAIDALPRLAKPAPKAAAAPAKPAAAPAKK